jgi:ribosomal protein S9
MANNTALVKTILYKSLAEGVYKEVVARTSSFYYYLGKTITWEDDTAPPQPVDSYEYERQCRNEMITIKEIKPSDVAFVIKRKNWVSDVIYDQYDDEYSEQVIGINIISGGSGYIDLYDTTITIEGGGGSGATAVVSEVVAGAVAGVVLTNRGDGYTSEPTVTITSPSGSGATLKATMGIAPSGAQKLEDANFYVVTDDYNVYKCLDNNNNARSTVKPSGTQLEPFTTLDGYVWKFMYNVPINLRNKFFTDDYIPVVSALTNHFYSNGTVDNIFISNKGSGYTSAVVSVTGDGYREADPIYINGISLASGGSRYGSSPTVEFSPPFGAASSFVANNNLNLGQIIYNFDSWDYYEVVTPGQTSTIPPTHRFGTVLNGTTALKYIGTRITGSVTSTNPQNIISVTVTSGGSAYTSPPTVTVSDPTGQDAVLQAVIGTSTIQSITKQSGGANYVSPIVEFIGGGGTGAAATAAVDVNGSITTLYITNHGSGYTTAPQIAISDPSGTGAQFTAVLSGSPVNSVEIISGGTGYTSPSVSFSGGGGAAAAATAEVETGVIDSITMNGSVREVVVVNSGSGYLYPPNVNFSGGGGLYAVAKSKIYADKVISTYITNAGENYTSVPSVTFGDLWEQGMEVYTNEQYSLYTNLYTVVTAGVFGSTKPTHTDGETYITSDEWIANTSVYSVVGSDEDINEPDRPKTLYYEDRLYQIMNDGTTGNDAPTHTDGDVINGDVVLRYLGIPASLVRAGTVAQGFAVLRYGAGYNTTPTATFVDVTGAGAEASFLTSKSEAKISAITDNGQIVYLVVEDPGVGYTKAALTVSGNGVGAALTADLSLGSISSQQANNEILTPAGTIDSIAVVSGGYSYGVANITIEGDGTGAQAEAVIDPVTNAITKINILKRGQDYTYANVKIIGNGNGALLRAIISPYGGHGKNSPDELFAKSLMFYSNISTDLNQGVTVGNDYRQVGIIKNPRVFNGYERFQGSIGSACYIVQAPINITKFKKDDDLYIERVSLPDIEWQPSLNLVLGDFIYVEDRIYTVVVSGIGGSEPPTTTSGSETNGFAVVTYVGSTKTKKQYRIVSVTETSALVQSLDNDAPESNDVFIKTSNITDNFTATSIGDPTFDKYSGQLMYIDNKQGFTPSADETITLRTIINF